MTETPTPPQPAQPAPQTQGAQVLNPHGFWQNMIAERDVIERRKANADLRIQVGGRQSIIFGDIGASISYAWHSFTKYPKMLAAGFVGPSNERIDIVVPPLNPALAGTELEQDLKHVAKLKKDAVEADTAALMKIAAQSEKGFFGKLNDYASYSSVANHARYKGEYVIENEPSTLAGIGHLGVIVGGAMLRNAMIKSSNTVAASYEDVAVPPLPANPGGAGPAGGTDRSGA